MRNSKRCETILIDWLGSSEHGEQVIIIIVFASWQQRTTLRILIYGSVFFFAGKGKNILYEKKKQKWGEKRALLVAPRCVQASADL